MLKTIHQIKFEKLRSSLNKNNNSRNNKCRDTKKRFHVLSKIQDAADPLGQLTSLGKRDSIPKEWGIKGGFKFFDVYPESEVKVRAKALVVDNSVLYVEIFFSLENLCYKSESLYNDAYERAKKIFQK